MLHGLHRVGGLQGANRRLRRCLNARGCVVSAAARRLALQPPANSGTGRTPAWAGVAAAAPGVAPDRPRKRCAATAAAAATASAVLPGWLADAWGPMSGGGTTPLQQPTQQPTQQPERRPAAAAAGNSGGGGAADDEEAAILELRRLRFADNARAAKVRPGGLCGVAYCGDWEFGKSKPAALGVSAHNARSTLPVIMVASQQACARQEGLPVSPKGQGSPCAWVRTAAHAAAATLAIHLKQQQLLGETPLFKIPLPSMRKP